MKFAVIGAVALLILGGAGAGVYFFFFNSPAEASAMAEDEGKAKEHAAKSEEAAEGAEAAAVEQFVQLEAIILPIIGDDGVSQTVLLSISIAAPDEMAAADIKHFSPRLKDAFIQDMYGALNRKSIIQDGVLQVGILKERLMRISTKVLGKEKVNDVLLQVVQQRPVG